MWEGVKVDGEKQPATLILLFTKKYTPYSYGVYFFLFVFVYDSRFEFSRGNFNEAREKRDFVFGIQRVPN